MAKAKADAEEEISKAKSDADKLAAEATLSLSKARAALQKSGATEGSPSWQGNGRGPIQQGDEGRPESQDASRRPLKTVATKQ